MSQRSHYGNPVGAPHSVTIPHKYQDPYRYPPRLHRTGDSALSSRMSSDVPPAWGPEMQDTYPILKWKQDVTTWSLATRTSEDKKGFLLYTQLQGVAKSYVENWLQDPAKSVRRTRRLQDGNKRYRSDVRREKMRRKIEESMMDAQIKQRSSRRGQEEDDDEPPAEEESEADASFASPQSRPVPKQQARTPTATAASSATAGAAGTEFVDASPIHVPDDESPRTPMRGGGLVHIAQGDANLASSDEEVDEPLNGCAIIVYKLMKHYAPNSVNITMSIIQDVHNFQKRAYESLEEAFTRWDIITERAAQANVSLTESPSIKFLQKLPIF